MEDKVIILKVGNEEYPTNCYIVFDKNRDAVIIDPGFDSNKIITAIKENKLNVDKIILTHCHADHLGALDEVKKFTQAKVYMHIDDIAGLEKDEKSYFVSLGINRQNIHENEINELKDGDVIIEGNLEFEVIHTPGHTSGSICLYEENLGILFTGDTIFHNCYGRCDLISGSIDDMGKSINKIFDRFDNITIYPGHEEVINIDKIKRKIRLLYRIRNS